MQVTGESKMIDHYEVHCKTCGWWSRREFKTKDAAEKTVIHHGALKIIHSKSVHPPMHQVEVVEF